MEKKNNDLVKVKEAQANEPAQGSSSSIPQGVGGVAEPVSTSATADVSINLTPTAAVVGEETGEAAAWLSPLSPTLQLQLSQRLLLNWACRAGLQVHGPGFGLGICDNPMFGSAADDAAPETDLAAVDVATLCEDALLPVGEASKKGETTKTFFLVAVPMWLLLA